MGDTRVPAISKSPPYYTNYIKEKIMSLIEYLDRTGKHVSAKTFEKYKDEKHDYSDWEALFNI